MVCRNAQRDGALEGDVRVMIRLVHDVHQRRPGVGAGGARAVAAGAIVVEEPLAVGERGRYRAGIEVRADRGATLAAGEQQQGEARRADRERITRAAARAGPSPR